MEKNQIKIKSKSKKKGMFISFILLIISLNSHSSFICTRPSHLMKINLKMVLYLHSRNSTSDNFHVYWRQYYLKFTNLSMLYLHFQLNLDNNDLLIVFQCYSQRHKNMPTQISHFICLGGKIKEYQMTEVHQHFSSVKSLVKTQNLVRC